MIWKMSEERVHHSLIKDSSSLGDQTIGKSPGTTKTSVTNIISQKKFLVPILPKSV